LNQPTKGSIGLNTL